MTALFLWTLLPLPRDLLRPPDALSLTITDRHGVLLRTTRASDGSRARWVPIARLSPSLLSATVAAEDRRFFDHSGVDAQGVARAAFANLRAGRVVSGASTITMQLARLLRPVSRGWTGKLVQAAWALRIERHLDKQRILEQYLNRVPLGQGAVGMTSGAALYFGADPGSLTVGQSALLAGLARSPARDNPFVSPRRAARRRAAVLARMRSLDFVSAGDALRAAEEPVVARGEAPAFLAPHFTSELLAARDTLEYSSGTLRSSLDLALQSEVEGEVRQTVTLLRDRGARQAAAVVLDNSTGEILAWVGSPDFWADTAGQTDMVASPRQPGSALKPFLYALAFDRGRSPATVLADVARSYQTTTGVYRPRNYDRRFHGPVRAREALASSYNVPAVALADEMSAGALLRTLRLAGFASLDHAAEHYGLGLALGNGDVTLLELANGYRALANGGLWRPVRWLEATGVAPSPDSSHRVVSAQAAALVLDVLSDAGARVPGFGVETPFDFPFRAAVKTGTSRHFTDNWAVATTGRFTAAVWAGNFSGRPMDGVSGVSGAGPLLHRVVMLTAARYGTGALPEPAQEGAQLVSICRVSGLRATARCPHLQEWVPAGSVPTRDCDWHQTDGGVRLPAEYAEWAAVHAPAPTLASLRLTSDSTPAGFRVVAPRDGDRYRIPPGVDPRYASIGLRAVGSDGTVRWFVDGRPNRGARFLLVPGMHTIVARASRGEESTVKVRVD